MMILRFTIILTAWLTISASEIPLVCPASIRVEQSPLEIPSGWQAVRLAGRELFRLNGASFSDGHPKDGAILRPARTTRKEARYDFTASYPEGLWISCSYSETVVTIAQKLPDGVTSCMVEYGNKPPGVITKIQCLKP